MKSSEEKSILIVKGVFDNLWWDIKKELDEIGIIHDVWGINEKNKKDIINAINGMIAGLGDMDRKVWKNRKVIGKDKASLIGAKIENLRKRVEDLKNRFEEDGFLEKFKINYKDIIEAMKKDMDSIGEFIGAKFESEDLSSHESSHEESLKKLWYEIRDLLLKMESKYGGKGLGINYDFMVSEGLGAIFNRLSEMSARSSIFETKKKRKSHPLTKKILNFRTLVLSEKEKIDKWKGAGNPNVTFEKAVSIKKYKKNMNKIGKDLNLKWD